MFKSAILVISLAVVAAPATAQTDVLRDRIVQELQEDGFTEIRIRKTWLGRLHFEAFSDTARREIVVNPVTGLILRDYLQLLAAEDSPGQGNSGGGGSKGGGPSGGGGDDDDDGDNGDDGDVDDNNDAGGGGVKDRSRGRSGKS